MHIKPYHAAVMTHPDIAKATQNVSSNPGVHHWDAIIYMIHHLKTTQTFFLTFGGKSTTVELIGCCDANHTNSPDHGCSIFGYAMMLVSSCFPWSSKEQTATALSTGEAEYYVTTHAGREITWMRQLLAKIRLEPPTATILHIDNTSSIQMIETLDHVTNHLKHINIAYHWIHEEVQKLIISARIYTI